MTVEKAPHIILIKEGNFEVRLYKPMIIATTAIRTAIRRNPGTSCWCRNFFRKN